MIGLELAVTCNGRVRKERLNSAHCIRLRCYRLKIAVIKLRYIHIFKLNSFRKHHVHSIHQTA